MEHRTLLHTRPSRFLVPALLALLVFSPMATFAATSPAGPPSLVRSGNEAFRAGDYRLAVSRYLQAKKQGNEGAVVDFNLGVAYYRLEDYNAADRAFRAAARDSKFTARSWYNLGLVHWAAEEDATARTWFDWVVKSSSDTKIKSLAGQAMLDIDRGLKHPRNRPAAPPGERTGVELALAGGWGHDDNVFRTPNETYVDLAQAGQPVVDPEPQAGEYIAANLLARNTFIGRRGTLYRLSYTFDGSFYPDSALSNANEHSHRASYYARAPFGKRGNGTLRTRVTLGAHREINYDPDSGLDRVVAGEEITDRFAYHNAILSSDYSHRLGPVIAGIRLRGEMRDYGSVDAVSEFDNSHYLAGAHVEFPVFRKAQLRLAYDYSMRDYRDRTARSLDGTFAGTNPALEYRYQELAANLRFNFNRQARMWVGYAASIRDDVFVGYDDYRLQTISLGGDWRLLSRVRLSLDARYDSYDFDNAFAFDIAQGGSLTRDSLEANLGIKVRLAGGLLLWSDVSYRDVDTTDPRLKYSRLQFPLGVTWEQRF